MVESESNNEIKRNDASVVSAPSNTEPSQYTLGEDMSSTTGASKSVRLPPNSMWDRRRAYRVIIDDVDLTPDDIKDPAFVIIDEMFTHAAFDVKTRTKSEAVLKLPKSRSKLAGLGQGQVYATTINLDDIHIDYTLNTEQGVIADDGDLSIAPSAFYLPKMNPITSYPPEINITLKETETQYLFALPCVSCDKATAEGAAVEEENTYYEYITVGKGRNRKMVTQETQTEETIKQARHTLATRPEKKNAMSFASVWDMHDTYARIAEKKEEEKEDEMVMYQSASPHLLRKKKKKDNQITKTLTFEDIAAMPQYLDAVLVTERVLASLEYASAQKRFRGLVTVDPLSLDLVYIYTMKPLWTFECEETAGQPIVYLTFNPKNPNILAVAHGKYGYADTCNGMVCVWCTKNPCKPERVYRFDDPVTAVGFSEKHPSWLACGFSNGDVIILDITSYTIKYIAKSKRETNPCFEPIWVVHWRCEEGDNEYVMTTCQDGRINRLQTTKTHEFICTPMMRVSTVEGKLKGLETAKTCLKVDVPITRYPAVLCLRWDSSIDHYYLVGTDEGCIHRCSTNYLNQHIDVYRAHAGPVMDMATSPFMSYLLASCGADNAIRLWIDGMDDVIMTLICPTAVTGVAFCPINSTIIISVSGNILSVWDLRRKVHKPCAEYTFPGLVTLTYIKFAACGHNVFVGDTLGRIHTFHLEDTPIPPFYQKKLLDQAIRDALCTRPQMLKQLDKLLKFKERKAKDE